MPRPAACRVPQARLRAPRPLQPRPVWQNFRGLFRAIDEGNAGLNIPAYNGDLFALDPALDALQVPDEVCAHFKELGDYDYRPVREVADAAENTAVRSVIDVDNRLWPSNVLPLRAVECALQLLAHPRSAKYKRARRKPNSYHPAANPRLGLDFGDA